MSGLLVVEDDPSIHEFLIELLDAELGGEVLAVHDGAAALDVLHARPDLSAILIDLQLPDLDGLTVVRRMQEDPALRAIPAVAMSATVTGHPEAALAAGCRAFVGKPFDLATLVDAVRSAMR